MIEGKSEDATDMMQVERFDEDAGEEVVLLSHNLGARSGPPSPLSWRAEPLLGSGPTQATVQTTVLSAVHSTVVSCAGLQGLAAVLRASCSVCIIYE